MIEIENYLGPWVKVKVALSIGLGLTIRVVFGLL